MMVPVKMNDMPKIKDCVMPILWIRSLANDGRRKVKRGVILSMRENAKIR